MVGATDAGLVEECAQPHEPTQRVRICCSARHRTIPAQPVRRPFAIVAYPRIRATDAAPTQARMDLRDRLLQHLVTPQAETRFGESYLVAHMARAAGCRPHQVWEELWGLL